MSIRLRLDRERAADVLRHMPPGPKRSVRAALMALAEDPMGHTVGLDVRELDRDGGTPRIFTSRFGDWRAVYAVGSDEVTVVRLFHRAQGYAWMERLE